MSTGVEEIINLLTIASSGNLDAKTALERIALLENDPAYYTMLAQIFGNVNVDIFLRQNAALQIKKNLNNSACLNNPSIQQAITVCLSDQNSNIAKVAATVMARAVHLKVWQADSVIQGLVDMVSAGPKIGSVRALSMIIEDNIELLDSTGKTPMLANVIVPLIANNDQAICGYALHATVIFLEQAGTNINSCPSYFAMQPLITPLITSLFDIITEKNIQLTEEMRIQTIRALVLTLAYTHAVLPHFQHYVDIMISTLENTGLSEDVRREAADFWRSVLYFPETLQQSRQYLPRVIPSLLQCLVYSDMELGMLVAKDCDWMEPDKPEHIKPKHFQGRSRNFHNDDEDGAENDEEVENWNLRRVSALTIDEIAQSYGDDVLQYVLQTVDKMIQPGQQWKVLEAGILAIGAICEGCYVGLTPYMQQLSTKFISQAGDQSSHYLVKSICVWTIGEMKEFLLENPDLLGGYIKVLLSLMISQAKYLQEASTAALKRLLDSAVSANLDQRVMAPFMDDIVRTCNICLKNYQLKNRQILLETLESVCIYYGSELGSESTLNVLMEPIIELWNSTSDTSPLILAYFECLSAICVALGQRIEPLAKEIYIRTTSLIELQVNARAQSLHNIDSRYDEEYLVTALDLLSGLFEAMGPSLSSLLQTNGQKLLKILLSAVNDDAVDVKRSSFAVIGDCASVSPILIQSSLDSICNCILAAFSNIDECHSKVASNASWALSSIITHQVDIDNLAMISAPHFDVFFTALCKALTELKLTHVMSNMAENMCLTIGQILHHDPNVIQRVGVNFTPIATIFCEYTRNIKNIELKEIAIRGFLFYTLANPSALQNCVPAFLDLVISVTDVASSDLKSSLRNQLISLKNLNQWSASWGSYNNEQKKRLHVAYGFQ